MKLQCRSKSPISVQIHVLLTNRLWKLNMNRIEESAPESMMLMLHLAVEAVAPVSQRIHDVHGTNPDDQQTMRFTNQDLMSILELSRSTIIQPSWWGSLWCCLEFAQIYLLFWRFQAVPGGHFCRWGPKISASDRRFHCFCAKIIMFLHASSAWRKAGSTSEPLVSKLGGLTTMALRRHTCSIYCKETKWILQGAFPNTFCDIWVWINTY